MKTVTLLITQLSLEFCSFRKIRKKYSIDYFHGKLYCDGDEDEGGTGGGEEENQEKKPPFVGLSSKITENSRNFQ